MGIGTYFLCIIRLLQEVPGIGRRSFAYISFHLSQTVFRKIQSLGLQQQYQKNPEFAVTMRMLPALAFVPPELVGWSFDHLVTIFPENAYPLCKYIEETYIGLMNLNGGRNSPIFPIDLWNISILYLKDYLGLLIWSRHGTVDIYYMWLSPPHNMEIH